MGSAATVAESIRLPVNVEDVTAEWLNEALARRSPGVAIDGLAITETMHGTAVKLRVTPSYRRNPDNLPSSLILKGASQDHRHLVEILFENEVRYYRQLAPILGFNGAECYFAESDHERHQHIVILEDLDLSGVRFCRVQDHLTYDQATQFLDILARMHARWWRSPEIEPGGMLGDLRINDSYPRDGSFAGQFVDHYLEPDNWKAAMRLPRAAALPKMFHDRDRMAAAILKIHELCSGTPQCLCYGDPHLGNLFIDRNGRAGVLDLQCIARGIWASDIAYFMGAGLDLIDRRRWEAALLSYYLGRLAALGVSDVPDFDGAWLEYRQQMFTGMFYWLIDPPSMQAEENACAVATRMAMAAVDLGTMDLLA